MAILLMLNRKTIVFLYPFKPCTWFSTDYHPARSCSTISLHCKLLSPIRILNRAHYFFGIFWEIALLKIFPPWHLTMPARKRGRDELEAQEPPEPPSLLKRLRNMWEFANLMQYIYIFGDAVKIDKDFDIEVCREISFHHPCNSISSY
jgi:hypothetical protein